MSKEVLLEAKNVKKYYKEIKAVDGVSLDIKEREIVGLVGESGCGKSTLGKVLIQLEKTTDGEIFFKKDNYKNFSKDSMKSFRRNVQMVFQDPYASLNPRKTIFQSVLAPLDTHKVGTKEQRLEKVKETLSFVGITESSFDRYPHELSGGQRQRVAIARAIVLDPSVVICDEPVSALDVSIRSQVLNLLKKIQKEKGISYLFISHDLSVVRYLCDRVVVMYLGKIVESGTKKDIFENSRHPYTRAILSAIPIPDVNADRERIILEGEVPSQSNPPKGCGFCTRCKYADDYCRNNRPSIEKVNETHEVACFKKEIYEEKKYEEKIY